MAKNDSEFFKRSKTVVEEFLQSVIIVDDRAFDTTSNSIPITLIEPGAIPTIGPVEENSPEDIKNEPFTKPEIQDETHNLDVKCVVDSFAQKGIVCAVFEPTRRDLPSLTNIVLKLTLKADIIILDWSLGDDKGRKALEILREIITSNLYSAEQLRLVVVYTANPKIIDVSSQIKRLLYDIKEKIQECEIQEGDDGFSFIAQSIKIVIFAKEEAKIPSIYMNRKVSFTDLADQITNEFTNMAYGLVPNTVLKSLSKIRSNTYRILKKFSRDLDAPYLTHRVLIPNAADGEELLSFLISRDLQGILDEAHVGNMANNEYAKLWIKDQIAKGMKFKHKSTQGIGDEDFSEEDITGLIDSGIESWKPVSRIGKPKYSHLLKLSLMFQGGDKSSSFPDEQFAYLTCMRSCYDGYKPYLTLGSVLKKERDEEYWICLQPSCDTVRLKTCQAFPFLKLMTGTEDDKFDLVLKEGKIFKNFILEKKLHNICVFTFIPDEGQKKVIPIKSEKKYQFEDVNGISFDWIGELRQEFALKIAHEISANFTRVGIDQSEWLRKRSR